MVSSYFCGGTFLYVSVKRRKKRACQSRQAHRLRGTVKSYAQIRQRHLWSWLGEGRTGRGHVRLGCRAAGGLLPTPGHGCLLRVFPDPSVPVISYSYSVLRPTGYRWRASALHRPASTPILHPGRFQPLASVSESHGSNVPACCWFVSVKTNVDLQWARRYEIILSYSSG